MAVGVITFQVAVVPLNMQKSEAVRDQALSLYSKLRDLGYDVLLDDRDERPGVKFADMELVGIPHRIVVSDRGLKNGTLEYRGRRDPDSTDIAIDESIDFIQQKLTAP